MELINGTVHPSESPSNHGLTQFTQQPMSTGNHGNSLHQDPSSDFLILSPPGSSSHTALTGPGSVVMDGLSHDNLGSDLTLEESLLRVRQLLQENQDLRENIEQTNQAMKTAYTTMKDWKDTWERERAEFRTKYDQTREVVSKLRAALQQREAAITQLNTKLEAARPEGGEDIGRLEAALTQHTTDKHQLSAQITTLQRQRDVLQQEVRVVTQAHTEAQEELVTLRADTEILSKAKVKAESESALLREVNERLQVEKRDLVALNNALQTELHNYKSLVTSTSSSENGGMGSSQVRDFVIVAENTVPKVDDVPLGTPGTKLETLIAEGDAEVGATRDREVAAAPGQREKRKGKQEQTMQDLLLQLSEEKNKMAELSNNNRALSAKLEQREAELVEKREELARMGRRVKGEIDRLQKEHQERVGVLRQQTESLQQQLTAARDSQNTPSHELSTARAQVMSLMQELQEAHHKCKDAQLTSQADRVRCVELEQKVGDFQRDLRRTRSEDDHLIDTLRETIKKLETKLDTQNWDLNQKTSGLADMQQKHKVLCEDYHELCTQFEDLKVEQSRRERDSLGGGLRQEYEGKVDNLTAQLMVAEESLETQKRLIRDLVKEKERLESQVETIPVHQAQAEVYKVDFEAERKAREDAHQEKESIKSEYGQLQRRYQQLQEELSKLKNVQLEEMQRRHGASLRQPSTSTYAAPAATYPSSTSTFPTSAGAPYPTYAQAAQFQPHQYTEYSQYSHDTQYPQYGRDIPPAAYPPQGNYPQHAYYATTPHAGYSPAGGDVVLPRQQQQGYGTHGRDMCDEASAQGGSVGNTDQSNSTSASKSSGGDQSQSRQLECPKCGSTYPDMEAMQAHFVDCLDMDA